MTPMISIIVIAVVACVGVYISWRAGRLDRLHARLEAARFALDAALVRRSSVALELSSSGLLDPATSLLLGSVAHDARPAAGRVLPRRLPPALVIGATADMAIMREESAFSPKTESFANAIGLTVDLIPPQYVAESLAAALLPEAQGKSFLLVRAAEARDTLPEALTAAGANVTIAEAYRNQVPSEAIPALQALFASPETCPDVITFTSASTVRNLFSLLEAANLSLPANVARASIGPITSQTLRDLGHEPTLEAAEATIPALVQAIAAHFS